MPLPSVHDGVARPLKFVAVTTLTRSLFVQSMNDGALLQTCVLN